MSAPEIHDDDNGADTINHQYIVFSEDEKNHKAINSKHVIKDKLFGWMVKNLGFCAVLEALVLVIFAVTIIVLSTSLTDQRTSIRSAGIAYIRWARTECPGTADIVYSGIMAGGKGLTDVPGGGSNYLCLTSSPHFNQSVAGKQTSRSRIYETEYRNYKTDGALNDYHNQNAPCVMCQSREGRTQVVMIPATTICPTGWTREYDGYLAAAKWNQTRTEYVCLDRKPESVPRAESGDLISYLFHVEIYGSQELPYGYKSGHDLTCAVCSM